MRAATPGVTTTQQAAPTVPYAFERSAAASLGFQFPMVAAGAQNYPVVSTGAPAGSVDKGADALVTAAAFRLDTCLPKRISGQFEIRAENLAVFPDMERALRESLMDSCGNALDEQVFNGNNASGQLHGLFMQATDVAAAGATVTFNTAISRFAKVMDSSDTGKAKLYTDTICKVTEMHRRRVFEYLDALEDRQVIVREQTGRYIVIHFFTSAAIMRGAPAAEHARIEARRENRHSRSASFRHIQRTGSERDCNASERATCKTLGVAARLSPLILRVNTPLSWISTACSGPEGPAASQKAENKGIDVFSTERRDTGG